MAEGLTPHQHPEHPPKSLWPVEAIAESLYAETEDIDDIYFGKGVLYHVGLSRTKVATWEQHEFIRVRAEHDELASADIAPLVIDEVGVQFHGTKDHSKWVLVNKDGQVFHHIPPSSPAPEYLSPTRSEADVASRDQPLREVPAASGSSEPAPELDEEQDDQPIPQGPFQTFPTPEASEQREKSNRVELSGNIAYEPTFRVFKSGNQRLQFSLAVHMEDGSTQYNVVKAFRERAAKYNGQIHKKDYVRIVGGRAYETITKDGKQTKREFIILWGLKPTGQGKP